MSLFINTLSADAVTTSSLICSQESNEQYACICPARLDEFQMYFLYLWLQIRFPLKCHCKEIYHFMNAHTLALLISWVCIYEHNLFILIYILRRRKFIHTPDNAHLFYIIAFHAYLYFYSIDEIEIFSIIIIYELIATGWRFLGIRYDIILQTMMWGRVERSIKSALCFVIDRKFDTIFTHIVMC